MTGTESILPDGVHLAKAVAAPIRNVDVPRAVHRYGYRQKQLGAGGRAAISRRPRSPITRERADGSGGIHLADTVVIPVHDVEVAGAVHCHIGGNANPGFGGGAAIPGEDQGPVAGYSVNDGLGTTDRYRRQRNESRL